MITDLDETGPINYLVVEFPGNRMTGEGFPLLVDLVDAGMVFRILDLVFATRDTDGTVTVVDITDIDGDGRLDLAVFRERPPDSSDPMTSRRPRRSWSRGTGPASSSTRTCGPHPSRPPSGAAVASSWPAAAWPSKPSSPRSTLQKRPKRPKPPTRRDPPTTPHLSKGLPMPGRLIRGVARTAVVAGSATAVSGRVSRRQQGRWAAKEEAAAAGRPPQPRPRRPRRRSINRSPPAAPSTDDKLAQLKQLGELKTQAYSPTPSSRRRRGRSSTADPVPDRAPKLTAREARPRAHPAHHGAPNRCRLSCSPTGRYPANGHSVESCRHLHHGFRPPFSQENAAPQSGVVGPCSYRLVGTNQDPPSWSPDRDPGPWQLSRVVHGSG